MKEYKNIDTNEIWTEDEIRYEYNHEAELQEQYSTFEEYMDHLLDLGRQKIGGLVERGKKWYAVLENDDDQDWGKGSESLNEAKEMAREWIAEGYTETHIAVIDVDDDDPFCVAVIRSDEFDDWGDKWVRPEHWQF